MQIYQDGGATIISHEGETYEADENGRFDVPEEVGHDLTRFAGFHVYTGDPEPTEEEAASAREAELLARVDELEKALAKKNAPRTPPKS